MSQSKSLMSFIIDFINIPHSPHWSEQSHTDLQISCIESNRLWQKHILMHFDHFIFSIIIAHQYSMIHTSISCSKEEKEFMMMKYVTSGSHLHQRFSRVWSNISQMTEMTSISKQHSVWYLSDSFDLMNLCERSETHHHLNHILYASTLNLIKMTSLHSYFSPPRSILIEETLQSNSPNHHLFSAQSEYYLYYSAYNQDNQIIHSSRRYLDHSSETMSSIKSKNYCSEPISIPQISRTIHSKREWWFRRRSEKSRKRTSN